MNYRVVDKRTGRDITFEQKEVFLKLMAAHGPKRQCKTWAERVLKAYRLAQKDFEDIYGFIPEAIYSRRNFNGR